MPLTSFYDNEKKGGILSAMEKQRAEKNAAQKKLSGGDRKKKFNELSLEDKNKCLVDLKKKNPVTIGDLDGQWYNSGGKSLDADELAKIKDRSVSYTSTLKFYCWIRKGNQLFLREFDNKFRETDKAFSQVAERNELAILVKGENFLGNKKLVSFESYIKPK